MVIPPGRERHTTRAMRTEASAQQGLAEKMTLASNTERTTCPGVRSTRRCQRRLYEHTRHPDSAVRSSNPQRTRPHLESRQQATVRMTFWGACSLPGTAQRSMQRKSTMAQRLRRCAMREITQAWLSMPEKAPALSALQFSANPDL